MRPIQRIEPILDKLNIKDFVEYLSKTSISKKINAKEIKFCVSEFNKHFDNFKNIWLDNPDLRLTQLLINCGLLPNNVGGWYYTEESDYCIQNKILKPRDLYFWGTFGKSGKEPLKYVALKDMSVSHIKACFKTQQQMNPAYREAMNRELLYRAKKIKKNKSTIKTKN